MSRSEFITAGDCPSIELAEGLQLRVLVSGQQGSRGLTTCAVTVVPGAGLPYHTHPTGESITVARGAADVSVEGRRYRLNAFDSIHIPAGVAHAVRNLSDGEAVLHTAFPTAAVERQFVDGPFPDVLCQGTDKSTPEQLIRFASAPRYQLADGTQACDLFARRLGSAGICGGHGLFQAGAGLPCHTHEYDESITIVSGRAVCQVAGREYELADFDTACVPRGRPHRFFNPGPQPMAMLWVYAGDEPDRVVVDQGHCDGTAASPT